MSSRSPSEGGRTSFSVGLAAAEQQDEDEKIFIPTEIMLDEETD